MNTLSELQGELHKLSAALDTLSRQAEDLKPRDADETQDFSALEALARQDPIKNPTLAKAGEFERDLYLRMASTAAFLEDAGRLEKLLYLCRLVAGSGSGQSAVELQKMAYDTERLDWQSAAGELKEMALPLLLDMMMLGSMAGPADERTLDFIASVAELMDVSEEDVSVAARLAAALLAQDEEKFRKVTTKRAYPELGYLVPEEWLKHTRFTEGKYQKKIQKNMECVWGFSTWYSNPHKSVDICAKEHVHAGTFVDAGVVLISFKRAFTYSVDQETWKVDSIKEPPPPDIKAIRSGLVFFMESSDTTREIFIISPFDSTEAFFEWYEQKKK